MKMENGACFLVEDAGKGTATAYRSDISPTGILFGSRASWAGGEPGEIERAVVAEGGATPESLDRSREGLRVSRGTALAPHPSCRLRMGS